MVTKHWKKIVALFLAITVLLAGAPGTIDLASAAPEDTAAGDATTTDTAAGDAANGDSKADAKKDEAKEQQNVGEDGEVVQQGAVGKVDKSKWITKKDYQLVAESDTYKMYLYEPRLSIMLENKETGKILESTLSDEKDDGNSNAAWNAYMKSGVIVNAIVGTKNTYQADLVLTKHTMNVTKSENGFSAEIYWEPYKFGFTVNVTLEGSDVVINVPDNSIKEEKEGTYINSISLFPMMGYSFLDDKKGYMLIPDGNGALINLDNKEGRYTTGFSQMIYGSDAGFSDNVAKKYLWDEIDTIQDANKVLAPIFGMAHTEEQTGYLAVVEKGEKRASVEAHPNGVMVNYNRCFAKFLLRDLYVQPLNNSNSGTITQAEVDRTHSDLQVRYMLLDDKEANYSSMANKYRDYLLNNKLLTKKESNYNTRIDFLGTDREEFLMGTTAVTMTKTEDAEKIIKELQDAGVKSALSVYKGWQDGGLFNVPIRDYDVDGHIGGKSKLNDLVKSAKEKNYKMYLYDDALRLNPSENTFSNEMIKKVNKRTYEEEIWAEVYDEFNFLTPEKSAQHLKNFVEDAAEDEVNQIAVSGISNTMFSYSYKGDYYSRSNAADAYSKVLDELDANTELVLEQPCAYLWKNADAFLDMPLGSSQYMYIDEEVPFLSMVLKGIVPMYSEYVNFEANKQEFVLQMIESGVFPSFYLTEEDSSALIYTNSADMYSTKYTTYKDAIIQYDAEFRALNDVVGDANIVGHEKQSNGVTVVTYNNGVKIYINYTEESKTVDGITVEGMSYSYKAGEAE